MERPAAGQVKKDVKRHAVSAMIVVRRISRFQAGS
jgi:hypothetical protein